MNDNAKAWVQALRSGEYQQAKGHLSKDGGYCCLGVACDIYKAVTPGFTYEVSKIHLPAQVKEWLGLAFHNGNFNTNNGSDPRKILTNLNDGMASIAGLTFAEIADVIESEPEGLFS